MLPKGGDGSHGKPNCCEVTWIPISRMEEGIDGSAGPGSCAQSRLPHRAIQESDVGSLCETGNSLTPPGTDVDVSSPSFASVAFSPKLFEMALMRSARKRTRLTFGRILCASLMALLVVGCDSDDSDPYLPDGVWVQVPGDMAECHSVDVLGDRLLLAGGRQGFYSFRFGEDSLASCGQVPLSWAQAPFGYGARATLSCDDVAYFGVAVWDTTDRPLYSADITDGLSGAWELNPVQGPTGNCLSLVRTCQGSLNSLSSFDCAYRGNDCGGNWQRTDFCYSFLEVTAIAVGCDTWIYGQSSFFAPYVARFDLEACPAGCVPTSVFPSHIDREISALTGDGEVTGAGEYGAENQLAILFLVEGGTSGFYKWDHGAEHVELIRQTSGGERLVVSPDKDMALLLADSLYIWHSEVATSVSVSLPEAGHPAILGVDWAAGIVVAGIRSIADNRIYLFLRRLPR